MSITDLLQPIKDRLNAATPGPWRLQKCSPCAERGRLEVNIWDEPGNVFIAGWCDEDPYEPSDAEFIASAPTDQARLIAAIEAVIGQCDQMDEVVALRSGIPETKSWRANCIRSAITQALGGDGA